MKIDPKVEKPLRRAYLAVVDHDVDGIATALRPLDAEQSKACLSYAAVVVAYVVNDVHPDPDAEAARVMADKLVASVSEWSGIDDRDKVAEFLLGCSTGDTAFASVASDDILPYSLITGGNLLSRYRPEGMRWFEYLDQIWNYAESLPEEA